MSKPIVAVVGRPNVGKSTLFNSLCGQQISIVKDTPGVTRDRIYAEVSWLNHNFTLIDTGGIAVSYTHLNDQILNIEELALETIKFLKKNYQPQLYSRYDITEDIFDNVDTETMMNPENAAALCIMEHIARKRGCIKKGSDIDYEKCAACILDDFREGKIGTISLERP